MTPLFRAILAAAITLAVGLSLSRVFIHFRWVDRVNWAAAATVPAIVGAIVYWSAR